MDRAGGEVAQVSSPVPVVSRTSGATSVQVGHVAPSSTCPASLIKLFGEAPLSVEYRSRRETTGAHLG